MKKIIVLLIALMPLLVACGEKNSKDIKTIARGDTLYYTCTDYTVWETIVLKNDTLNRIIIVRERDIYNERLWSRKIYTYNFINAYSTRYFSN